ncbi:MAG: peptidase U32 family protein [Bacteroidota bacterium]
MIQSIEIMSPVGSYESLMAAIQAGAGSVYFGVGKMNMRSRSSANFTLDDLARITALCKENNVRAYLTLNTVVFDNETEEMNALVDAAVEHGISAIIASDISVMEYARDKGMEVHISTQCNITNAGAVRFYARYADVMVTARELSLDKVAAIVQTIKQENICGPSGNPVKIEIFVHGALCMAISGKCYISLDNFNSSANRGACFQPCRRGYAVHDLEDGLELVVDNKYIMSPKDLCTIGFIDAIVNAGATVLKIEGRGRSPEYVKAATMCYREAVESLAAGTYNEEAVKGWIQRLDSVYNRGFWDGYYLGKHTGEWSERYGSQATQQKTYIGKITNYFSKLGVAEIKLETAQLCAGDELLIIGPTTGVLEETVREIRLDDGLTNTANKGDICSIPVSAIVRRSDKIYKLTPVSRSQS